MKNYHLGTKRIFTFFACAGFALCGVAQIDIGFRVDSDWGAGANVTLTITNTTASAIPNWTLEFDYASTISPYSHATVLAHVGHHQVLTSLAYAVVPANGTLSFQCGAAPGSLGATQPANYLFNGTPTGGSGATPPTLSVADAQASEGNSGTTPLQFTFRLSHAATNLVSTHYSTASDSAQTGTDFLATAGTVTFSAGQTQQLVTVNILGDRTPEFDEAVRLILSGPTHCSLARSNIIGTILDDDRVPLTFYSAWRATHNVPAPVGDMADTDGDGQTTIGEYVFALDPNLPDADASPLQSGRAHGFLQMTYPAWRPDIAYRVETADALASSWTTNGVSETSDGQMRTARVSAPPEVPSRFLKLRASLLPNTSRFLELYSAIHDPTNGYFSAQGIPYHAAETLLCEAPDYGHETTSEAYSYYLLLEAMYGRVSGDWSRLAAAWTNMETYMIPTHDDQPSAASLNATKAATYAPEWEQPSLYPAQLNPGATAGPDPLFGELKTTYGTADLYGMHWLLDVDNWYGYGRRGDGTSRPAYINTFQRGEQESVWETIPQPSWDNFNWGGPNGYLDLFTGDATYARQWRYTSAPDADARAIQAVYWAKQWADQQGGSVTVDALAAKAARLGDSLRYALFDKYFRNITNNAVAGTGREAAHFLVSWYYAWGGSVGSGGGWAWRIGSSHCHFGYQNPVTAWVLGNSTPFIPGSPTARQDWTNSLRRQLEFYRWLQSAEGGIAGGASSSWNGRYETPPPGTPTFYGMAYTPHPVYHDPPSNEWFGFQTWSMQRVAELYYLTGDSLAKTVLDKWVAWTLANVQLTNNTYAIPATLTWSGQPDSWNPAAAGANAGLHVTVTDWNQDVGIASSVARSLLAYAAGTKRWATEQVTARQTARTLLDRIWATARDAHGLSVPEVRGDYRRFFEQPVYAPTNWLGHMPHGDTITNGVTFLGLRSQYQLDPAFPALQAAYTNWVAGGKVGSFPSPTYRYHRFWAQVDAALANAEYDLLFPQ